MDTSCRQIKRVCDAQVTLHVYWIWMLKNERALPIPDAEESDFMLEQTAVPRLHDIGMSFPTGMKIAPQYSYRGELAPV